MPPAETTARPAFAGKESDQQIASELFDAMVSMARFFPKSAPIRVQLDSLVQFMTSRHNDKTAEEQRYDIERVLNENSAVFAREEQDDIVWYLTTVEGVAPSGSTSTTDSHSLAKRFQEPVPVTSAPESYRSRRARGRATEEVGGLEPGTAEVPEAVETVEPSLARVVPEPVDVEPAVEVDLSEIDAAGLASIIESTLAQEPGVAYFGDEWWSEDKVATLSRGDLRRIREYILERGEPLTDETLLQDVLGVRPGSDNYDVERFRVNYRLSSEQREFEFVGTPDQRRWSTNGLPTIGTTKRKLSEIGTDYRFLIEYPGQVEETGEPVIEHVLTYYEYEYGVLPYTAAFAALFPKPMLADQRVAVLSFESPQTYETILAELHFPTGNRGGYVAGLEKFFSGNLIPGALITIERDENDGKYLLEYLPVSGEDRKLLQLDEKKNKYVFRPTTFYCATQDSMVLNDGRFDRLANASPLDERTRRRLDETLAITFERVGDVVEADGGSQYMAIIDDLLTVANVERPMTGDVIRDLVRSDAYPQFTSDPDVEDVFYYKPIQE